MSLRFTQLSFAAEVKEWINELIKTLGLRFEHADIEIRDPDRRRGDLILWEKRPSKPALLIEIWDPRTPPWEYALKSALAKAWSNNIPYFAVWNMTHFYCWETFESETTFSGEDLDKLWWPHSGVPEVVIPFPVTYDEAILKYKETIKNYLKIFLKEFEQIYYGIKPRPLLGIDERFIYRLRGSIDALSIPIFGYVRNLSEKDPDFRGRLIRYFVEQGWTFSGSDEDYDKIARQYVYLLINKILFYNIVRSTPPYTKHLRRITIPQPVTRGDELKEILDRYFERAYDVLGAYETILFSDFLDSIIPPDDIVDSLKDLITNLNQYDFSQINYEILGNIFQKLIPEEERHKLGQYFTRSDIVDLIIGFTVRNPDDKVLDGGCGAGTFLVRSYVRKKLLNPNKSHRDLIKDLYGIDIAKFPAHLAMINLASRDLSQLGESPRILHRDFFDTDPGGEYPITEVRGTASTIKLPEKFDAVVMNPPYTRQEEMEDILEEEKEKAYKKSINDWKRMRRDKYQKRDPKIDKRSSIYVYFFIHGGYFLKEGGRMGLITSNSWLDVDYGGDLQRYFLENFKIIAIIESKVERWFEDADINTAITIVERCSNSNERDNNIVKFVYLKRPLSEFIPPTKNEDERWRYIEDLVRFIENTNTYYEDERIRIYPKRQRELWEEGYDEEEREYIGSKWGKYIRAPQIFFKILENR